MTTEEQAREIIATVVDHLIGGELVSVDPDLLSDVLTLLRAAEAAAYERATPCVELLRLVQPLMEHYVIADDIARALARWDAGR